jgi:hypothetical protein
LVENTSYVTKYLILPPWLQEYFLEKKREDVGIEIYNI